MDALDPDSRFVFAVLSTRPLEDDEWEGSPERRALLAMCERCWPSERSQRQ
jgi:hypothetical protein